MTPAVLRHESDEHGRLLRVQRAADVRLRGVVNGYCGYLHEGTGVARRREIAQDQVTIILGFGPPLRVSGPGHAAAEIDCKRQAHGSGRPQPNRCRRRLRSLIPEHL